MANNYKFIISSLIMAIGIALAGFFINAGMKYNKNFERAIAVKGLSERIVKSDEAIWNINIQQSGENIQNLYSEVKKSQIAIKDFLLANGFIDKEIRVLSSSTVDNRQYREAKVPYSIYSGVVVKTKDVDKVDQVSQNISTLIDTGVIISSNKVSYSFTDLNSIKEDMLNDATKNAKLAAETFAHNSNSRIGNIKRANQGLFAINSIGSGYDDGSSIEKKVRVVTSVEFFIE